MRKTMIKIFLLAAFLTTWSVAVNAQQTTAKQTAEFDQLIDRYFDSLNETDGKRRMELTKQVWAENAIQYVFPDNEDKGYAEISRRSEKVQKQNPGAAIRRTSKIELVRDNYIRFNWEFGKPGSEPIVSGVDFAIVVDGKLRLVTGFFDNKQSPAKN